MKVMLFQLLIFGLDVLTNPVNGAIHRCFTKLLTIINDRLGSRQLNLSASL